MLDSLSRFDCMITTTSSHLQQGLKIRPMSDKLFDLIIYKFHQPWCTAYSEMEHYQIHTVFPQQLFVF